MKRNILILGTALVLLVSACAPATPTVNPADVQQTAQAAAFTMVALTQAAIPTATALPPTETPSPTPAVTNTVPALPTQDGLATVDGLSTGLPTSLPTFTPQSATGSTGNQDPCNQPLTAWEGPTASFTIFNQTKPQGTIILSMYVVTDLGQCGYLIVSGNSFSGPVGQYSAGAFVSGKRDLKVFGAFRITQGSWKIVVKNEVITAAGGCYPSC
ncbi:MAG: hypothetical protein WCC12_09560 [Anaerolineales bacterium]